MSVLYNSIITNVESQNVVNQFRWEKNKIKIIRVQLDPPLTNNHLLSITIFAKELNKNTDLSHSNQLFFECENYYIFNEL